MKIFHGLLQCRTPKRFTVRVAAETNLARSFRNSSVKAQQGNLRVSQRIGKLWNSRLTTVKFPSKDSNDQLMKYEELAFRSIKKVSFREIMSEAKRNVIKTFMPKGYPDSVTRDYLGFAKWEFIRNVAGSVTGVTGGDKICVCFQVLSTQTLLYSMGLGEKSIPLAATLNWVIKDGLGQLGVAIQLSSLLELLSPLFPGTFLIIASISNIDGCKKSSESPQDIRNHVPTPQNVSSREVFIRRYRSPFKIPLVIGPALRNYTSADHDDDLRSALKHRGFLHPEEYFILHAPNRHRIQSSRLPHVSIWFSQNAKSKDVIKGFYHACAIRHALEHVDPVSSNDGDHVSDIIKRTHEWIDSSFDTLMDALEENQWDIEYLFLIDNEESKLIVEEVRG
ncbi:13738_t:CDS:2 [Acaulospora colombiana]|uniref:13738_t:CDS:1 n=1 Tax=Acaulospora colombiana TaxID=27376 RepID=A0ACA9K5I9_9GLOM|nr:13738_t:CDS:2 [Acaulospora colombiana]